MYLNFSFKIHLFEKEAKNILDFLQKYLESQLDNYCISSYQIVFKTRYVRKLIFRQNVGCIEMECQLIIPSLNR